MSDEADEARRGRKSPGAYRTISEVADELQVPQHVLRFWETKFPQIRPLKRGGGRRYYRPEDIVLLRRISALLYVQGYTIKGVQRLLREGGEGDAPAEADVELPVEAPTEVAAAPDGPEADAPRPPHPSPWCGYAPNPPAPPPIRRPRPPPTPPRWPPRRPRSPACAPCWARQPANCARCATSCSGPPPRPDRPQRWKPVRRAGEMAAQPRAGTVRSARRAVRRRSRKDQRHAEEALALRHAHACRDPVRLHHHHDAAACLGRQLLDAAGGTGACGRLKRPKHTRYD
jgi:DNA-binding transcriptional MerR regulator